MDVKERLTFYKSTPVRIDLIQYGIPVGSQSSLIVRYEMSYSWMSRSTFLGGSSGHSTSFRKLGMKYSILLLLLSQR